MPPSLKIDRDATGHLPEAGLTMVALTPKMRNCFPVRWGATGVLVTLIDEGKASGIGIKRGEVIRQVNQEDVWLPERVIARYKRAKRRPARLDPALWSRARRFPLHRAGRALTVPAWRGLRAS